MKNSSNTIVHIINGHPYRQQLLTLRQAQAIFEVLFDLGVTDVNSLMDEKISNIVSMLFKSGVLARLILIVLIPDSDDCPVLTEDDILNLSITELEEVVMNFFELNPRVISLSKDFVVSLAGMKRTFTSQSS